MQRLAFTLALGMLSALASSGLAPQLATAAEWPSSGESLTPCPLLSGNLKPAPARPADPARPAGVSAGTQELNQAASEMLVRLSALASALAESLATADQAPARVERPAKSSQPSGDAKVQQQPSSTGASGEVREQSSKTSKRPRKLIAPYASLDDLGLVPDYQYGPYRAAIPTFLPAHDERLGILHSLDEQFRTTFGLSPIGRPWLAGVPVPAVIVPSGVPKAHRKASREDRSVLDLVADARHSSGLDEVLQLNAQNQGLTPAPAAADVAVDAQPKVHRYWFEDYTFGYETGFGYRSNESYLDALLAASSAGAFTDRASAGDDEADADLGFELVIDGPTRYLFLREGSADGASNPPVDVASSRHAPLCDLDPLAAADGTSKRGWVGCEDSADGDGQGLDNPAMAAAPSESSKPELAPMVTAAAQMLNDLGTAFIYLSCDLHHLAQHIDAQPKSPGRLAEEPAPAQRRVGQKIDTKDFFGL